LKEHKQHAIQKPANLIYGVNEIPPPHSLALLGIQHAALLIASLVATTFLGRAIGASPSQIEAFVNVGLIAGGVASILQATHRWNLGSGYFCLHTSSFIFFQSSVHAASSGGLPLVFGMTALSGLAEAALSKIVPRLRSLFPPEVSGLVVATVGISLAPYALKSLVGIGRDDPVSEPVEIIVGLATLGLIIGMNVWSRGMARLYSILTGIFVGYVLSYATGIMPTEHLDRVIHASFLSLPHLEHPGFSFNMSFLVPFLIAALCASLKLTGDIISCQKINDVAWKRVDIDSVARGLVADGLGTSLAGLLGGSGLASSSSNIGMACATGATSRYLGYSTGAVFIALAFMPKIALVLAFMPKPVVGAIVIYSSCFMIVTGWSIIMTRMLDARKTFVIGIPLIMGMSVDSLPELYSSIPPELKPIFGSSLALATITAMLLNLIFRIGISSKKDLELRPGIDTYQEIYEFFERTGAEWGARKEVVNQAMFAMHELYESITMHNLADGKVTLSAAFDEYNINLDIRYRGAEMPFAYNSPDPEHIIENEASLAMLSGFLVRQYADKIRTESKDGYCRIQLHFEH
jgi:NCS2 family nucleobase:cation symporter-2